MLHTGSQLSPGLAMCFGGNDTFDKSIFWLARFLYTGKSWLKRPAVPAQKKKVAHCLASAGLTGLAPSRDELVCVISSHSSSISSSLTAAALFFKYF
jgi:hypothetical protein